MGWYTTTCLVRDLTLKFNRVSSHMVYSIEKQFSELREREREREREITVLTGKSVESLDREQDSNHEDIQIVFRWATKVTYTQQDIDISHSPLRTLDVLGQSSRIGRR